MHTSCFTLPGDINEPQYDKTNKVSVRPAKTQISLGIRPIWADAQADLSLRWVHSFCWFCRLVAHFLASVSHAEIFQVCKNFKFVQKTTTWISLLSTIAFKLKYAFILSILC